MKVKISVSMDEKTIKKVEEKVEDSAFRNKSHFIELAVQKALQEAEK